MDKNCRIVTNHNINQIQKAKQLGYSNFTLYCYKNPNRRTHVCGLPVEVNDFGFGEEEILMSMKRMLFDYFRDSGEVFDYVKIYYTCKKEE